jgi:stalled ribosome alternative rescue factor ArfA
MKISAVLKVVRTPMFRQRVVPAKRGQGAYSRANQKRIEKNALQQN